MQHLNNQEPSCSGYPSAYGILGLHDDGQGYFIENGIKVAQLSGISVAEQKSNPQLQLEAYAIAFEYYLSTQNSSLTESDIALALNQLSEIPDTGIVNLLARDMQVYEILRFMSSPQKGQQYGFTPQHFNLITLFGSEHFALLSSDQITISENGILDDQGHVYAPASVASVEYGPAIWNPAPTCNYSSRNGVPISAITIHTIQGTYAGAISWSQNCASNVSFHYVIRSSDGQVTQMLLEEDKGWHVGSENPYTIGYEHEGYVNDPIWYTEAMYNSSADLSRDIINSGYGIPGLRTYFGTSSATIDVLGGCTKIKGHQHYPNQTHTDPGINWDWEKYYRLINNTWAPNLISSPSGVLTDTGGSSGNYSDDEREFWLIAPNNAASITLNFSVFDIEANWDYLFVYDGDSIDAPLIGQYTGSTIPSIVSTGGSLLLEFRSDCATTSVGWEATYTTLPADNTPPTTAITVPNAWQTDDFSAAFSDIDTESAIQERFYLVAQKPINNVAPQSDGSYGFVYEPFEDGATQWNTITGNYGIVSGGFELNDTIEQNSNAYTLVNQDGNQSYLYEWEQTILGNASNQRAGIHFFCDDPNLTNRGNSYFVYLRTSNLVQIYSVENDIFNLESNIPFTIDSNITYHCATTYEPTTGWIRVFINGELVGAWQDPTPLTNGNAISLRSGGCHVRFDNVRVFQSRGTSVSIPAGPNDLLSLESEGAMPTGFIYSVVQDAMNNWSTVTVDSVLLDFSVPEIMYLNDGSGSDLDTVYTNTISANWQAIDIHSDIANYEVAIGTLPMLNNILDWNSNGIQEALSYVVSNPVNNQVYHISVRALNGAGLEDTFISDGQRYIGSLDVIDKQKLQTATLYPNPATSTISIGQIQDEVNLFIYDANGRLTIQQTTMPNTPVNISTLTPGVYRVILASGATMVVQELMVLD
jgi:hypothetical protein